MDVIKPLGLIYDALKDEWVLELLSYYCSIESPPKKCSNSTTMPSSYESCHFDMRISMPPSSSPSSPFPSPLPSSSSSAGDIDCSSKCKQSSPKRRSSSNPCMVPYLVHLVMCHGHGKLWHVVKSGCMGCFKPNNKKQKKCKSVGSSSVNVNNALTHKRNKSAEVREEDLKAAILFCKNFVTTDCFSC